MREIEGDVPEILAEDLETFGAEPVRGTAINRHRGSAPQAADLFGVVASYAERGITFPIDALERLIALQERREVTDARDAFFRAVAAFQDEVPQLRKSRQVDYVTRDGTRVQYGYAPLGEIARVIRPILSRHGLSYSWDSALEADRLAVTCTLRHIDGHSEKSTFACPIDSAAKMSGAQKAGAALTYARRQSLVQVCGLSNVDDDVDGAEPDDGETITPEQVTALSDLMRDVGADKTRFLAWLKVERLVDLPASRFEQARAALEAKRPKAAS